MIFPETEYDKVDKIRGFDISIITTAKTDEEAESLLELLGLPLRKKLLKRDYYPKGGFMARKAYDRKSEEKTKI